MQFSEVDGVNSMGIQRRLSHSMFVACVLFSGTVATAAPWDLTYPTGQDPQSLATGDLNGDGLTDLVVANFGDNTVSVLRNTTVNVGDPISFDTQQTFSAGISPKGVAIADINGDGNGDIVVSDYNGNTVSVLLNATPPGGDTFNFLTAQTFAVGVTPVTVAVADIDGDGRPDVIVANSSESGTVSVLINTTAVGATTSSFDAQLVLGTGSETSSVAVAEINDDGRPDIVVANAGDNSVGVLLNTTTAVGSPMFASTVVFAVGNGPTTVIASDVNGDGIADVVTSNGGSNDVSILLNTTPAGASAVSFASAQAVPVGHYPRSVATANLYLLGHNDLVVANANDNTLTVLFNLTPAGATSVDIFPQRPVPTGAFPVFVALDDVSGDGIADIIVANGDEATVSIPIDTPLSDVIFRDGFE
jgi:hypothetical protein